MLLFHKYFLQGMVVHNFESYVVAYVFAQGCLLYAVMTFACESSVSVSTSASIVMNMNVYEHQSRVLVKSKRRSHTGRASSPGPADE
jgi:hypothetical protein